jgi:hypothetical protein
MIPTLNNNDEWLAIFKAVTALDAAVETLVERDRSRLENSRQIVSATW